MNKGERIDPLLLDVKWLRLFEQLHDTRSVTRAAQRLGQSQPTVSIWLSKLRTALRDPLFVRTPGAMLPTPRADALIGPVRELLQSLRALSAPIAAFRPDEATRSFCIGMTDASHVTLLPQLLARVRALAPRVKIVAARIDAGTASALQSGEMDVAIGSAAWLESGVYQQALFPQDWICLVNASHPRIRGAFTLRAYKEEGHVDIAAGTGAPLLAQALQRRRIARRVMLELPGFLGLGAIVSSCDLIATLPRQIGETLAGTAGLAIHACPFPVSGFVVRQHWHERFHHDSANRWLRGVIAETFAPASRSTRPARRTRP